MVSNASDFILWGVDDVFYFKDVNVTENLEILRDNIDIISATLRLSPQINYCHTVDAKTTVPNFTPIRSHALKFDRTQGTHDWNYPFELCATIFRKDDVISYLNTINSKYGITGLSHPNKLEVCGSRLFTRKDHADEKKVFCTCLDSVVLSVITINRVQDVCNAPIYEESSGDIKYLDTLLWTDRELDAEFYLENAKTVTSCHIGDFKLRG